MAATYLHPKVQAYCIAQRNLSYVMRDQDIVSIQGATLILYGLAHLRSDIFSSTPIDISAKLSVFYPMIGTTRASVGLDFIRLITGAWNGSPAPAVADGYIDFSGNNTTTMQIFRTAFVPPANQTSYHISYYSTVDVAGAFPTMLEIGTTNGSGMTLGMKGSGSTTHASLYDTTSISTPTFDVDGELPTNNAFIVSRRSSTSVSFFTTLDDTGTFNPRAFRNSPETSNSVSYAPGQVILGGNTGGPGGTYSTRSCQGMSAGDALNATEAYALSAAYYFMFLNKFI